MSHTPGRVWTELLAEWEIDEETVTDYVSDNDRVFDARMQDLFTEYGMRIWAWEMTDNAEERP
jgi:hypothetical protein